MSTKHSMTRDDIKLAIFYQEMRCRWAHEDIARGVAVAENRAELRDAGESLVYLTRLLRGQRVD